MDLNAKQDCRDKYTPAQIITALQNSGGIYSLAAQQLKCTVNTVKNYVKRYEPVADALAEIKDELLDLAEAQLLKLIRNEQLGAIIFYLKTQGKHRGYTERVENTGPDNGPIALKFAVEDARSDIARKLDRIALVGTESAVSERAHRRGSSKPCS